MSGCPNDPYEVHHIKWIEDRGTDTYSNLIVLCANCHKDAHGKNPKGKTIKKDTLKNIVKKRSKSKADEIKAILKK
jgi:predicted HNH restriction endonuclease